MYSNPLGWRRISPSLLGDLVGLAVKPPSILILKKWQEGRWESQNHRTVWVGRVEDWRVTCWMG